MRSKMRLTSEIELVADLADGVGGFARGLEGRAPDHVAAGFVEFGEIGA